MISEPSGKTLMRGNIMLCWKRNNIAGQDGSNGWTSWK